LFIVFFHFNKKIESVEYNCFVTFNPSNENQVKRKLWGFIAAIQKLKYRK